MADAENVTQRLEQIGSQDPSIINDRIRIRNPRFTAYSEYLRNQGIDLSEAMERRASGFDNEGGLNFELELELLDTLVKWDDVARMSREDWPEELEAQRPQMPVDWRPSVRNGSYNAARIIYLKHLGASEDNVDPRIEGAFEYLGWLSDRYVIDAGPAAYISHILSRHRDIGEGLRRVVLMPEQWSEAAQETITRQFEQYYLGLPPLVSDDEKAGSDDELRIREDGLYVRRDLDDSGRNWGVRWGGEIPTAALAAAVGMEPTAFRQLINRYELNPHSTTPDVPMPRWSLVRCDQYLFSVLPLEDDPEHVIVSRIDVLSGEGRYLLEDLLKVYEAGIQHGNKELW